MARRERDAAVLGRIGLRFRIVGEAEVERRALGDLAARRRDDLLAPRGAPALLDRSGRRGASIAGTPAPEQGAEHAVDQPARAAVDQRQGGRDQRMVGRAEPDLLRQREPQHHPRLAVVGQALAGRAVDQRVEVGQAAQRLAGDRQRERLVGGRQACAAAAAASSVCPRRSTASSICSAAWRAPRPSTLGIGRPTHHLGS